MGVTSVKAGFQARNPKKRQKAAGCPFKYSIGSRHHKTPAELCSFILHWRQSCQKTRKLKETVFLMKFSRWNY